MLLPRRNRKPQLGATPLAPLGRLPPPSIAPILRLQGPCVPGWSVLWLLKSPDHLTFSCTMSLLSIVQENVPPWHTRDPYASVLALKTPCSL